MITRLTLPLQLLEFSGLAVGSAVSTDGLTNYRAVGAEMHLWVPNTTAPSQLSIRPRSWDRVQGRNIGQVGQKAAGMASAEM